MSPARPARRMPRPPALPPAQAATACQPAPLQRPATQGANARAGSAMRPCRQSAARPPPATATPTLAWPWPRRISRSSICKNRPESGRLDQLASALTCTSTIHPSPRRAAVTSGVPSASEAHVFSRRSGDGSANTWRLTVTSSGMLSPAKGEASGNGASVCGASQLSAPPSARLAGRNRTGSHSSGSSARPGLAKRSSTPPDASQVSSRATVAAPGCNLSRVTRTLGPSSSKASSPSWRNAAKSVSAERR